MDLLSKQTVVAVWVIAFIVPIECACRTRDGMHDAKTNVTRSHALQDDTDKLRSVFSEFVFVRHGIYNPSSVPTHTMDVHPLPDLKPGQQYVFHRHATDNDALFKTIQDRLKSSGFEITAADQIGWRYIGGLFFRIKFAKGTQNYVLFNQADVNILGNAELSKTWSTDDYVLGLGPRAN